MSDAAFFDLDNTLIKGSVLFYLGVGMVRHRLVTRREITRHAWHHLAYRWRGERSGQVADLRDRALTLGAGLRVAEIVALGERVYDERLGARIWDGTRQLAQGHLGAGEPVWLVTAAPVELAEIVAGRLGLSGALGTVAEIRDGAWTGQLVGDILHGQAKADAVQALAQHNGFNLDQCAAYSDSINDLPLLELVGAPHAVNPDHQLRRIARERAWPVHDFRNARRALRIAAPAAAAATAVVTALWSRSARRRHTVIDGRTRRRRNPTHDRMVRGEQRLGTTRPRHAS
jgi:HAD superfamily hydrolase (TIGR01490 family)